MERKRVVEETSIMRPSSIYAEETLFPYYAWRRRRGIHKSCLSYCETAKELVVRLLLLHTISIHPSILLVAAIGIRPGQKLSMTTWKSGASCGNRCSTPAFSQVSGSRLHERASRLRGFPQILHFPMAKSAFRRHEIVGTRRVPPTL